MSTPSNLLNPITKANEFAWKGHKYKNSERDCNVLSIELKRIEVK
jgi:hypothetical protein